MLGQLRLYWLANLRPSVPDSNRFTRIEHFEHSETRTACAAKADEIMFSELYQSCPRLSLADWNRTLGPVGIDCAGSLEH